MAIIELRQYLLLPGKRDALIDLFETHLIEAQEECGMRIVGTFRDLHDPQRFVWVRSFHDMPSRAESLSSFYFGPVWQRHRNAANATMIDSDNVLLLRPAWAGSGLDQVDAPRPAGQAAGVVLTGIVSLPDAAGEDDFLYLLDEIEPCLKAAQARIVACLVTEPAENTFPALPVRSGEDVLVWFAGLPEDAPGRTDYLRAQLSEVVSGWPGGTSSFEMRELAPTSRSRLTGRSRSEFAPIEMVRGTEGPS
jgi:hypothetical protein